MTRRTRRERREAGIGRMPQCRNTAAPFVAMLLVACSSNSTPEPSDARESSDETQQALSNADEDVSVQLVHEQGVVRRIVGSPLIRSSSFVEKGYSDEQGPHPSSLRTERERLLERVADARADDVIPVTIILEELPTNWSHLRALSEDADRKAFISTLSARVASAQKSLREWLVAAGALNVRSLEIRNQIHADVPSSKIGALLARSDVIEVSADEQISNTEEWSGRDASIETRNTAAFRTFGVNGGTGSRISGQPIRLAIIEGLDDGGFTNYPLLGHPSWQRPNGTTRLSASDCTTGAGTCTPTTSTVGLVAHHGARVSWLAGGSILDGQDPAFPGTNTVAQQERSGILTQSNVSYYITNSTADIAKAIFSAILDGADVINLSQGIGLNNPANLCNRNYNPSDLNGWIRTAADNGVVFVKSAGNQGNPGSCNITYPAWAPEAISVTNLDSGGAGAPPDYATLSLRPSSSVGGIGIGVYPFGYSATMSGVGISTSGVVTRYPTANGGGSYETAGQSSGTSYAAPIVAGLVGGLRQAFSQIGAPMNDARMLETQLLLLGDGTSMTSLLGSGRIRAHWPSSNDLLSSWGWGWRSFVMYTNQDVYWTVGDSAAEASYLTVWKWATMFFPSNLGNVPDIDFYVENECPPGGGVSSVVWNTSYDTRAKFRLNQAEIGGRCLRMHAHSYNLPPEGVRVYSADYFAWTSAATH